VPATRFGRHRSRATVWACHGRTRRPDSRRRRSAEGWTSVPPLLRRGASRSSLGYAPGSARPPARLLASRCADIVIGAGNARTWRLTARAVAERPDGVPSRPTDVTDEEQVRGHGAASRRRARPASTSWSQRGRHPDAPADRAEHPGVLRSFNLKRAVRVLCTREAGLTSLAQGSCAIVNVSSVRGWNGSEAARTPRRPIPGCRCSRG